MLSTSTISIVIGVVCLILSLPALGSKNKFWAYTLSIIGFIVTGIALFTVNTQLILLYLNKQPLPDYPYINLQYIVYSSLVMLILFFSHIAISISLIATRKIK
jgi:hypothetical protein